MSADLLTTRAVAKPWGRTQLWSGFEEHEGTEPIGEIWFEKQSEADAELLVKYLFTSEKLSIQVHPDDAQARARGFERGKDEAWLILDAEPDSTIALGPKRPLSEADFRTAIQDGSIVDLLDWRPVKAGDFIYSPAGTVHAIGAGLTLIEIQQNLDLTYRLYDFGRPRELHVDDGVAVSLRDPFTAPPVPSRQELLAEGPKFVVERVVDRRSIAFRGATGLLVPTNGGGEVNGRKFKAGECWELTQQAEIACEEGGEALLAYPGSHPL